MDGIMLWISASASISPTVPDIPIREAPQATLVVYTVLMALITLAFLAWWALRERRQGAALPLLLLGGTLAGLMEPWSDNVVLVGCALFSIGISLACLHFVARSAPGVARLLRSSQSQRRLRRGAAARTGR